MDGVARRGVRRTEFNFRGDRLYPMECFLSAKIEFCTSDPSSRDAVHAEPSNLILDATDQENRLVLGISVFEVASFDEK